MTVTKSLRTISENLTDAHCACHVKIPLFDVAAAGVSAVLCGAKNHETHEAIRVLSAYETQSGLTLGEMEVGQKTNEIPVMRE